MATEKKVTQYGETVTVRGATYLTWVVECTCDYDGETTSYPHACAMARNHLYYAHATE